MSMDKVYIAYCSERHVDAEFHLFTTLEKANECVKRFAENELSYDDCLEFDPVDGRYRYYGDENKAYVVELEEECLNI